MGCRRGEVGVTPTTKDSQIGVIWMSEKEGLIGCTKLESFGGVEIEKVGGGVEGFNPVRRQHASLE